MTLNPNNKLLDDTTKEVFLRNFRYCFNAINHFKSWKPSLKRKQNPADQNVGKKEEKILTTLFMNHSKKSLTELLRHLKPENICYTNPVLKIRLKNSL